ncbi:septation protein IspZ [Gammaproteobacteria bacterium]|nr:septation protein IspZ [Gammaproteobacteria bacterium]
MINVIYEFLLAALFFIVYKLYDVYMATIVIMVGATIQVFATRIFKGKFDKKQSIILFVLLFFGSLTLYFHDPIFIKWKLTVVYWAVGLAFVLSHFVGKKTLIQYLFASVGPDSNKINIPSSVLRSLNVAWSLFFIILGGINILIAYNFSTDFWVNFKLYGVFGALILFVVVQSLFLKKHLMVEE